MKKHMLKIALAVAVVLGVGSIATGSVILARTGAPDQGPATEAGNVDATHPVLSQAPDRAIGAGNEKAAMVVGPDLVLTMAGSDPVTDPVTVTAPFAESGGTSPVAAASAGSAGVVGASGVSAASTGAGSVPSAPGRNMQQAAVAKPVAAMPRPSSDSPARAGGSSAGPTGTGARGPAASPPEVPAIPGTSTGVKPTEIANVVPPVLANVVPPVLAGVVPPVLAGVVPPVLADAVPPVLAGVNPDTVPHNYGPNDLPIPPSLDLNEPVITAGAKDPVASPGNTVPEPSTLALLGMAALGLVARRRRRA